MLCIPRLANGDVDEDDDDKQNRVSEVNLYFHIPKPTKRVRKGIV